MRRAEYNKLRVVAQTELKPKDSHAVYYVWRRRRKREEEGNVKRRRREGEAKKEEKGDIKG